MKLFIRNSSESLVEVTVKPSATIALVKATYRRQPGFLGNRSHIQLQYRGEVLDDTLTLKHYHVKDSAVLYVSACCSAGEARSIGHHG